MSDLALKVRPRKRVLVKMLPIAGDYHNPSGLTLVDKKKHWDHDFRRAVVVALDPRIAWQIPEVLIGDVVIFKGSAGFTLDGDILDEDDQYEAPLKGESFRWLRAKEIDAIDEKATQDSLCQ